MLIRNYFLMYSIQGQRVLFWMILYLLLFLSTAVKGVPPSQTWQVKGALAAWEDTIPEVKANALDKLIQLGALDRIPDSQISQIVTLLKDNNSKNRSSAANALGELGHRAKAYLGDIAALLENENSDIRSAAVKALGNLEPLSKDYLPQMAALLGDKKVSSAAVEALSHFGDLSKDYLPKMAALLENNNENIRSAAVKALGNLGESSKTYLPLIAALLEDNNEDVRFDTVEVLGKLGHLPKAYINKIATLLKDSNANVRFAAITTLGKMGTLSEPYIPSIIRFLEDQQIADKKDKQRVNSAAAKALGNLGTVAEKYIPVLIKQLIERLKRSPTFSLSFFWNISEKKGFESQLGLSIDNTATKATVEALRNLGSFSEEDISQMGTLFENEDMNIRASAALAFSHLGVVAKRYLPQIAALLKYESQDNKLQGKVRAAAAISLSYMGNDVAKAYLPQIATLLKYESENEENVRIVGVLALIQMGEIAKPYIPQIATLLDSESDKKFIRPMTALLLDKLGETKTYIRKIATFLEYDQEDEVFSSLTGVFLLGKMGKLSKAYIPQIFALLKGKNEKEMFSSFSSIFIIFALQNIGEVDVKFISPILNTLYNHRGESSIDRIFSSFSSTFSHPRFLAHFLGGGNPEMKILLKWIGEPENNLPETITYKEAKQALAVFDKVWESTATFPKIRSDLAEQMTVVIRQRDVPWQHDDLPLLRGHLKHLKSIKSLYVDVVAAEIDAIIKRQ